MTSRPLQVAYSRTTLHSPHCKYCTGWIKFCYWHASISYHAHSHNYFPSTLYTGGCPTTPSLPFQVTHLLPTLDLHPCEDYIILLWKILHGYQLLTIKVATISSFTHPPPLYLETRKLSITSIAAGAFTTLTALQTLLVFHSHETWINWN